VLADIRGGDENLREGDRVVWEEVERKIVFRFRVGVDDPRDIDDETDCLSIYQSIANVKTVIQQTNFAI
jgi:hypothetical protein